MSRDNELHSIESERAILACIMGSDGMDLPDIHATGLSARDFYRAPHARLYRFLLDRADEGLSLERMAVYEAVMLTQQAQEFGGIQFISSLADDPPLTVDPHIDNVRSLAYLRRLAQGGNWITQQAKQPIYGKPSTHVEAVQEKIEQMWERLESDRPDNGLTTSAGASDLAARLDRDPNDRPNYSPTGISNLDHIIDGFGPGELIVLGGRSSMGKSVGAVCVTLNMAMNGSRVAFASLEMPSQQQADRYISQLSGVPYRDMGEKGLHRLTASDKRKIRGALPTYSSLPIHIQDSDVYTIRQLRSYARRQQAMHRRSETPLCGLVVDYIGLMEAAPGQRQSEATSGWVKALKKLAKELGIWILCLAQINRAAENLVDAIPRISNLADSTMMENTADMVILCYRPGYYDDHAPEFDVDWIVGKNRTGPRNVTVQLAWDPTTGTHFDREDLPTTARGRR